MNLTQEGPFATRDEAQAFAEGVRYANSFFGESAIPSPEPVNVYENGDSWWVEVGIEEEEWGNDDDE